VFRGAAHYLRLWDSVAGARPDVLIANSTYTRDRIRRYYGRDAEVITPPIETRRFERLAATAGAGGRAAGAPEEAQASFLVVSALVPNKRVDLAVAAFAGRPERLLVVGEGPERARLERLAGPNVSFLGWVSDQALDDLLAGCRGVVHPGVDDFGMVMAEALAAGKPVVASCEGGAADVVREGDTGVVFETATVEAVRAALDRLALLRGGFDPARLRAYARRFDRAVFERRFAEAVERGFREQQLAPAGGRPHGAPARRFALGLGKEGRL
jgi:glycosyltransferase involved in cell wall biosynthesis